jgi:hypothetical protein
MFMPQRYIFDFPELVVPPAHTWQETLQRESGFSPAQAEAIVINTHLSVVRNVERIQKQVGVAVVLGITDDFVRNNVPERLQEVFGAATPLYEAVVHRIGLVLSGEMDMPNLSAGQND